MLTNLVSVSETNPNKKTDTETSNACLKKMGFLHQNLLKELRRSRKAKLTPEEAGEGADPVVPESVEEEIDESALVDGMPGRGGERNRLVELQNLGAGFPGQSEDPRAVQSEGEILSQMWKTIQRWRFVENPGDQMPKL